MDDLPVLYRDLGRVHGARSAVQWRDCCHGAVPASRRLSAEPDGSSTLIHLERYPPSTHDG